MTNQRNKFVMKRSVWMLSLASLAVALSTSARAQNDQAADVAKQLSNPLASGRFP